MMPSDAGKTSGRKRSSATQLGHESEFVSLKTLAGQWDCSRTTVSRLLEKAGVPAYYFGCGRSGSKRYLKADVDHFLQAIEFIV